jgi:hypothetical protein
MLINFRCMYGTHVPLTATNHPFERIPISWFARSFIPPLFSQETRVVMTRPTAHQPDLFPGSFCFEF